jgi:hypothetical protein
MKYKKAAEAAQVNEAQSIHTVNKTQSKHNLRKGTNNPLPSATRSFPEGNVAD